MCESYWGQCESCKRTVRLSGKCEKCSMRAESVSAIWEG